MAGRARLQDAGFVMTPGWPLWLVCLAVPVLLFVFKWLEWL